MKRILFFLAMLISGISQAQVSKVMIQASGLTCSMCSNAINKALKSIDYVDKVDANIKNSTFEISFKPNSVVDFDRLKRKVEDAGFFVSRFVVQVHVNNVPVKNDGEVMIDGKAFYFINVKDQVLNGEKSLTVLDKGFIPAKEYKKNESITKASSYKTGVVNGTRVYHVTI